MRYLLIYFIYFTTKVLCGRPRVYNALITTNQELLPSRAYPAVSPIIGQPVYYATDLHQKQHIQNVEEQHSYQESSYTYQGEQIDENIYQDDGYDDQQFQGYSHDVPQQELQTQHERNHGVSEQSIGQIRGQQQVRLSEVNRSDKRQRFQKQPEQQIYEQSLDQENRGYQKQHRQEQWAHDQQIPTRSPHNNNNNNYERPTETSRSRLREKQPLTSPQPQIKQTTGLPPQPPQFFSNGGIPYNNQPLNIPVVPPPPIPVKIKI